MIKNIRVLHITAHLGGGIGKALSGLTQDSSGISHSIVCLERPEKFQFVNQIKQSGTEVILAPSQRQLRNLAENADIVQVEWWGHPAVMAALCGTPPLPAIRLLLWCHVSGLHTPTIPTALIKIAHRCLFTSPCSLETEEVQSLPPDDRNKLGVIHSAGGINELPLPVRSIEDPLRAGYLGSLNFSKLHPDYVNFLASVTLPDFQVRMIGDETNRDILESQCRQAGCKGMLEFRGYCPDIVTELKNINVIPYILNPQHYGTTENALLEAMAMGVVPVVLNNPVESNLITNHKTGLIVKTPQEFGEVIRWLHENPLERLTLSEQATKKVRSRFSLDRLKTDMLEQYHIIIQNEKSIIPFQEKLGTDPSQWFLMQQRETSFFSTQSNRSEIPPYSFHGLVEQKKGSVYHFCNYFKNNQQLRIWSQWLSTMK